MNQSSDSFESLPMEFRQRLERIVPESQWPTVRASFFQSTLPSFRINTLIVSDIPAAIDQLRQDQIPVQSLSWCDHAFQTTIEARSVLTHHQLADQGAIYLHNLSSIYAGLALQVQPGHTVLDMAAAPGGKTLHLAALMQGQGMLSAVEVVRQRFFRLKDNLKRAQADFVKCYLMDGRQVASKTGPRFDRILLDAPCSSEARFDVHDPDSYQKWSLRKIAECSRKQKGLIKSAFQALRPGGQMLYSTCSFAPEENERIVAGLLKKFGDQCELMELPLPFDNHQPGLTVWEDQTMPEILSRCRRVLPNGSFNGLFYALIRKHPDA